MTPLGQLGALVVGHLLHYLCTGAAITPGAWRRWAVGTDWMLINVVLVGPLLVWLILDFSSHTLLWTDLWTAPLALLAYDLCFYFLHKACHDHVWLYTNVHAVHHRFTVSDHAWSAFFAHPLEHAFVNVLPMLLGMRLLRVSLPSALVVLCLGVVNTQLAHSNPRGSHAHHHREGRLHLSSLWDRFLNQRCSDPACEW